MTSDQALEQRISRLEQRVDALERIEHTIEGLRTDFSGFRADFAEYRTEQATILARILATLEELQRRPIAFRWPWERI